MAVGQTQSSGGAGFDWGSIVGAGTQVTTGLFDLFQAQQSAKIANQLSQTQAAQLAAQQRIEAEKAKTKRQMIAAGVIVAIVLILVIAIIIIRRRRKGK